MDTVNTNGLYQQIDVRGASMAEACPPSKAPQDCAGLVAAPRLDARLPNGFRSTVKVGTPCTLSDILTVSGTRAVVELSALGCATVTVQHHIAWPPKDRHGAPTRSGATGAP